MIDNVTPIRAPIKGRTIDEMEDTINEQQNLIEEMDKGMKLMIEVFTNYEQRLRAMETQLGILWKDRKNRPHILRPSGKPAP